MNNTMTYGQVFSHLKRWFMSRGGDILADDQAIMDYLNLTIQDIYNEDNAVFRHKLEIIEGVSNGEHTVFKTIYPIHKIQSCKYYNNNNEIITDENFSLKPTLFGIDDTLDIMFSNKEILAHKNIKKIRVLYLMDYEPVGLSDKDKVIPLPYRYLPVLLKLAFDWASPINLMAGEVAATDFYSHGITRLNKIAQNDGVTDYINVSPAY